MNRDEEQQMHIYEDEEDVEETYVEDDEVADVIHDTEETGMMEDDEAEDDEAEEPTGDSEVLLEDDSVQGFFEHKKPVFAIDLHPKQQNLAVSGGEDDRAYVWRLDTGEQAATLEKHEDSVASARFSSDGALVATGGMDGRVNVYRTDGYAKCAALDGPNEVQWLDWHPKGSVLLAGAQDGSLWMWSLPTGDFMNVFTGHSAPVSCGRFTNSGRNVVSGAEDGSLIIWDPKTAAIVRQFVPEDERFHQDGITSLAVAKDDQVILTGSMDCTAKLVHVNGNILGTLDGSTESVEAVGLCSVLPLAATGSVDGTLGIWDVNTMRLRTTLKHDDAVTKLLWHHNTPLLTSVSMDCTVRTWDARTGDNVRVWKGHQEGIMDFAMTADGATVVTASDDGCCLVFAK
ncbi:60S ribosomal subunit assembly or modification protein [Coemansia spiralis]|uniref:60S ribosomal subunit assembly or modification protein n=2 Tax=Coemansia TaxID=4863 RepID=A0A9W8G4H4_9FUNG|nr:60S ribosomal subunit assembly or modification protein [Coemansia umbellata]KAJ2622643.1 60S ribosomal subunit assembly or modification protein [Coemansia sp. RSA 1358]KAJ2671289.1 60S ribosomal subunit assembly or modification protein [Coemansia spiralis]